MLRPFRTLRHVSSVAASRGRQFALRHMPRWLALRLAMVRRPRVLNLELTAKCGLACPLCSTHIVGRSETFFDVDVLQRLLGERTPFRWAALHVMGEPLEHPRVFEVIETLEERGIRTQFSTNGMDLGESAEGLLDAGLSAVSVAIDGDDEESYARYRVGGDFEQVTGGVRRLLELRAERGLSKPHVQLQGILFPYNRRRSEQLEGFLRSLGPDTVFLKEPSTFADVGRWFEGAGDHGIEPARIEAAERRAERFLEEEKVDPEVPVRRETSSGARRRYRDNPICPLLLKANVLADGRVVACTLDSLGEVTLGHLGTETLEEIWSGETRRRALEDYQAGRMRLCEMCVLVQR